MLDSAVTGMDALVVDISDNEDTLLSVIVSLVLLISLGDNSDAEGDKIVVVDGDMLDDGIRLILDSIDGLDIVITDVDSLAVKDTALVNEISVTIVLPLVDISDNDNTELSVLETLVL